jgi:tellurite methyltransferase
MSDEDRRKWDARYRDNGAESTTPSPFLCSLAADVLPTRGRALDVAGGAGRNALWLARRGLDVTIVDVSTEGLALARVSAETSGVRLALVAADLERDPLPPGPFDVVLSFNFLRRPLFPAMAAALAPGGVLIYLQPTRSNLERHARPPAAFLLEDGELPALVPPTLEVVRYHEGWFTDDPSAPPAEARHEARLVARRR